MNKKLLLPLLALALAACSDKEQPTPEKQEVNVETTTKFLTLNVVSGHGTRADATYEDGTTTENAVNQVRFFFFDASGNPFPVWENKGTGNGSFNSYQDWYPNTTDVTTPSSGENAVEKILSVTLDLQMPTNYTEGQPSLVLAVLNPPASVLNLTTSQSVDLGASTITLAGPSLETLRTTVSDFRTGLMSQGTFVMSNSVYVDNGEIVDATVISDENFGANEEDAEQDPITIYVERVLARVDFIMGLSEEQNPSITLSDGSKIYYVGKYDVYNGTDTSDGESENLYVKLVGWNITGTSNVSRLVKLVDAGWTNSMIFGEGSIDPWNSDNYHRSFWAVNPNPNTTSFDYLFGPYEGTAGADSFPSQSNPIPYTGTSTTYLQENANAYNVGTNGVINPESPEYATCVIIGAQLVDNTGNPYPLCKWNYYYYTLPVLKAKFATSYFSNLYKKTESNGVVTYTSLSVDDFTFATATQLDITDPDEASYYVYPVLTETAETYTWTYGNTEDAAVMTTDAVNTYLRDAVNHIMVWNNGMSYYFFQIKHLGEEGSPAYFGIVRNHIYSSTLSSLTGLGTPVYDSTETIYPEKTQSEDNIVTVAIKILQWRIVAQEYNLEW